MSGPYAALFNANVVGCVTRWIEDGAADTMLRFIRAETTARQKLAAEIMPKGSYRADLLSFNMWLPLPKPWTRSGFVEHMRSTGLGVVASDAFMANGTAPDAVGICLGGPVSRPQVKGVLEYIAPALVESPALASAFL